MKRIEVDVAVIGAGTAGLAAYRAAAAAGRRAVIIEGGPGGTTCARVGCMPSKLLIAAAEAAHGASRWPEFGLRLEGALRVDGRAVMERVRRERDRFVGFVREGVERIPEEDRIHGYARFEDDRTLSVGELRIRFGRAVIATGSSPAVPAMLREAGERLLVNDDVFEWKDLPRSVAVFGPGVIGLELGQALHRLGVRVIMFGRDGLQGPFSDPTLRDYAIRHFRDEFEFYPHAHVQVVSELPDGVAIMHRDEEGLERREVVDYVIAATGRKPNVDWLGLERTSLQRDERGVPLFDRHTMQCGNSPIFIAGDADNDVPLLHEAADEGRIAGRNAALWPDVEPGLRRAPLAIAFCEPQIVIVGAKFADLAPGAFVTGAASFENQGRSRVMLRNKGMMHVFAATDSGRLLGAEIFGPDAEHLGHLLAWALQAGFTVERTLEMPFYHPVVEEGLRTALRAADAALREHWKRSG
ncbi:MAG: dihydrolipoyl dehydrogenase [Gammaproteobacteria bacterium]|jgi:dihydrolipoamide dehydrogenase|nr:dihydrolipoyl dehydrogenase [Gammaproteobacteria bacterium]